MLDVSSDHLFYPCLSQKVFRVFKPGEQETRPKIPLELILGADVSYIDFQGTQRVL